jgi:glycosyltransferase involved in cell wall biosynthesis
MRIAFCCFYQAYPPVSGAAAVSFNIAKFFEGETVLIQAGPRPGSTEVQGVRVLTVPGATEGKFAKIATLRSRLRAIVNELCRFRPELVILEGASWAVYHWMLLRAVRRALPQTRVVYHAHNVEYVLRQQWNGRTIAMITRWAEGRLLTDSDLATAVSEVDRGVFRTLYDADTAVVPNGVDADRFASISPHETERIRSKYGIGNSAIIFSGLSAYPPNRVAITFLRDDVMPLLLQHIASAQLVITGGDIPRPKGWMITPGIVPHHELPALLASCKVAAAPVFSGSGTRLKILEAMAAGVPVVATSKGAEGLPFGHGEHLLIAHSAADFAGSLRQLTINRELRDRVRTNAAKAVQQHFDWRVIAPELANAIARRHGNP